MEEQSYGTWQDWLLCLCLAIALSVDTPNFVGKHKKKPKKINTPQPVDLAKKIDNSLLTSIVSAAIEIILAALQWNGVQMKWIASIALYAVPISVSLWAFWKWEKAQEWRRFKRVVVCSLIGIVLSSIAAVGVITQYRRDQPVSSVLVITSDVTGMAYTQGTKVGGIEWEHPEDDDLRLYVENSGQDIIQNLDLTITLSGTSIRAIGQMSDVQGVEFHHPDVKYPPLRLRANANDDSSISVPEVMQRIFPNRARNGWRIFCPRLLGKSTLHIIIAAPVGKSIGVAANTVKTNGSYELMPSQGSKAVKVDVNTKVMR